MIITIIVRLRQPVAAPEPPRAVPVGHHAIPHVLLMNSEQIINERPSRMSCKQQIVINTELQHVC